MDSSQHEGSEIPRLIWTIGSPIIFTVGVLGNILTISVLSRSNYKKTSTSVFLTFLAIADLLVVATMLPRWWIIYMFGIDIRHMSNAFCKLHWFLTYFNGCVSNAILVAVTTERIISIVKPYKVKSWCTINSAFFSSISIILILVAFNGHTLYGMSLFSVTQYSFDHLGMNTTIKCQEDQPRFLTGNSSNTIDTGNNNETKPENFDITARLLETGNRTMDGLLRLCNLTESNICIYNSNHSTLVREDDILNNESCEQVLRTVNTFSMCWIKDKTYEQFYQGPFQVMVTTVYNVIPETSILIGMIVILRQLDASRKLRKKMRLNATRYTGVKPRKSAFESQSAQITRSLLLVNAVFVCCTTPVFVFLYLRTTFIDEDKGMTESQEIIWAVFNMLFYINHAINFILYFLSGARFRKQVKETLRCNRQRNTVNGNSNVGETNNRRDLSDYTHNISSISQF